MWGRWKLSQAGIRMIESETLEAYCNEQLQISMFEDYCPNGLQVEGRPEVRRLMVGVTACQALIDTAVDWRADALLVHHGFFWKSESPAIRGVKGKRIRSLICNGINLLAYHLPLDAHPMWGNNAQLAAKLSFPAPQPTGAGRGLVWCSELPERLSADDISARLHSALGREVLLIPAGGNDIKRVGWCTGAAQGFIEDAAGLGLDAYISGEISESTVHLARELGVHYFAAGHHATELFGVQALGEHLSERFSLEYRFVDIHNPV